MRRATRHGVVKVKQLAPKRKVSTLYLAKSLATTTTGKLANCTAYQLLDQGTQPLEHDIWLSPTGSTEGAVAPREFARYIMALVSQFRCLFSSPRVTAVIRDTRPHFRSS